MGGLVVGLSRPPLRGRPGRPESLVLEEEAGEGPRALGPRHGSVTSLGREVRRLSRRGPHPAPLPLPVTLTRQVLTARLRPPRLPKGKRVQETRPTPTSTAPSRPVRGLCGVGLP